MAASLTPNTALELWNRGWWLHAIAIRVAPPELREQYNAADPKLSSPPPSLPADRAPPETLWDVLGAVGEALPHVQSYMKPLTDHWARKNDALRQMREIATGYLAGKQLTGLGYVVPRKPDATPAEIPPDVWSGRIDWDNSTVSGNGLEFVAVRVVATAAIPKIIAGLLPPPESSQTTRRGRQPVKVFVIEGYETLKSAGRVDFSKTMTEIYKPIRAALSLRYPDRAGQFANLSDETIRKYISALFRNDRAAGKR